MILSRPENRFLQKPFTAKACSIRHGSHWRKVPHRLSGLIRRLNRARPRASAPAVLDEGRQSSDREASRSTAGRTAFVEEEGLKSGSRLQAHGGRPSPGGVAARKAADPEARSARAGPAWRYYYDYPQSAAIGYT